MPFAGDGYQVFRNVRDPKYGATGTGETDDYAAIQAAITDGNRCGANCNSTSTKGAIIYFPPGTYAISRPLVQYYYTAFVGDPNGKPTIKPFPGFQGMALIDTDVYYENSNGANW
jgi:glucan 1,3-beta-glucosidase